MRILKNIWAQLHRFVLWALLLSLFWGWFYLNFVGDTDREKKIILCVEATELDRRGLSLALEDAGLPAGIKMIQVRGFDYDIFGSAVIGDLYVMKESTLRATRKESPGKLAPFPLPDGAEGWSFEGVPYGVLICDPAAGRTVAGDYIAYASEEPEAWYLCLDAEGPHAADGAALAVALEFLTITK